MFGFLIKMKFTQHKIYHFKMNNVMAFGMFTILYNHLCLIPFFFLKNHLPRGDPHTIKQQFQWGVGLIPGWGAKIPHASWPKNQNIKQKQYWNKCHKDFRKKKKNSTHQKKT